MKRGLPAEDIQRAIIRALDMFDAWTERTGFLDTNVSYNRQIKLIIRDAVYCGIFAALGIKQILPSERR